MTAKVLELFPGRATVEPEADELSAHHDLGYEVPQPRTRPAIAVADGKPRCRKCNEVPPNGVLHGMGDRPERVYCGSCVGSYNARRAGRR